MSKVKIEIIDREEVLKAQERRLSAYDQKLKEASAEKKEKVDKC